MTDELLPCPFCGGTAAFMRAECGGRYVSCSHCHVASPLFYDCGEDCYTRMVESWNTRHTPDVQEWASGLCSEHQTPDPTCRICNPAIQAAIDAALLKMKQEIDALYANGKHTSVSDFYEDCLDILSLWGVDNPLAEAQEIDHRADELANVCIKQNEMYAEAQARIAELESRLELTHAYNLEGKKVPAPEGMPDGITCRDATIRMQDEQIADLTVQLAEAKKDIMKCSTFHLPGCRKMMYDLQSSPCTCKDVWAEICIAMKENK